MTVYTQYAYNTMTTSTDFYIESVNKATTLHDLETVAFLLSINRVLNIHEREQIAKHAMQKKNELLSINNEQQ